MTGTITRQPTAKVYGDILENSGITITSGRYITAFRLIAQLQYAGVSADDMVFLRDIELASGDLRYGENRDVWSGFGCRKSELLLEDIKKYPGKDIWHGYDDSYTFNRWDQLIPDMGSGNAGGRVTNRLGVITDRKNAYETLITNPQKGVEIIRDMYAFFARLPSKLQDDYLGIIDTPKELFWASYLIYDPKAFIEKLRKKFGHDLPTPPTDIKQKIESVYNAILSSIAPDNQEDMRHILRLLVLTTIKVEKGAIVRKQIDDLLSFDITSIPTEWQEGNLESIALTEERIRRLSEALAIEENYQVMKRWWGEIPDEIKPENLLKPIPKRSK